jgi:hypothetical protein
MVLTYIALWEIYAKNSLLSLKSTSNYLVNLRFNCSRYLLQFRVHKLLLLECTSARHFLQFLYLFPCLQGEAWTGAE